MIAPAITISGKDIFVVEDHAHAIKAWAIIGKQLGSPPILLTLDHHSDTRPGFNHAIHVDRRVPTNPENVALVVQEYCQELDLNDEARFQKAVERLVNDEHIDAATTAGIIDHAYAITYQSGTPTHPKEFPNSAEISKAVQENPNMTAEEIVELPFAPYDMPFNRIFELPQTCHPGCVAPYHNDDCIRPHYDHALESSFLDIKLATIQKMANSIGVPDILRTAFILDIDLDYFHTAKAIAPDNITTFRTLVKSAYAITIAREPKHVEWQKLKGEPITAETLLPRLLEHITGALSE